jgi:hypothetical protein
MSSVLGWLLDETARQELLSLFPPVYPDVIAHHVTLRAKAPASMPLPSTRAREIVGQADDGLGVQALVVSIEGTTGRPGGGTYHITWSLDRSQGRKPVDSNAVITERGWTACNPVPIRLNPARI